MGRARDLVNLLNSSGLIALPSKVAGVLPDANAPSGSVIQVVQATTTTQLVTSTPNTVIDTALSASITPVSANSKILVSVHLPFILNMTTDGYCGFYIKRNGTIVYNPGTDTSGGSFAYGAAGVSQFDGAFSMLYLDSPLSASPINYTIAVNLYPMAGATVKTPYNPGAGGGIQTGVITLAEIAG